MLTKFFDIMMPTVLAMDRTKILIYITIMTPPIIAVTIFEFMKKIPRLFFLRCFMLSGLFCYCLMFGELFNWPKGVQATLGVLTFALFYIGTVAGVYKLFKAPAATGEEKRQYTRRAWICVFVLVYITALAIWLLVEFA